MSSIWSRSSGPGSLSIWTRALQGIEFGDGTAKVMAGMTVKDMLLAAGERNLTIITGQDPDVGFGGWLAGAGHGPLTTIYGMGADQVVEMEVVTARGEFLTINNHHHPDIFWAMRGVSPNNGLQRSSQLMIKGGGSTYAIMISATVKTYPNIEVAILSHNYTTTPESEDFWNMLTTFHNEIPYLSDAGVMGYYYAFANLSAVIPNNPEIGIVSVTFLIAEKSTSEAQAILLRMEKKFRSTTIIRDDKSVPNFSQAWAAFPPGSVGLNARLGSRLLDKKALASSNLTSVLKTAMPKKDVRILLGNLVAGRKPVNNAVLPAWRSTYAHVIISKNWEIPSERDASWRDLPQHTQALIDLAPDMGAYMSESDPSDPNWQQNYYGSNYPRLLAIKKKWDPQGVFWCKPCVGNELWSVSDGDGIGQNGGKLCRV
ncbi:MAG: hypothetical protein GOMPHAMPRED_003171 [Gomphillus americanus]|uniref:FAD-binding PCMH-type domain-containing protein n=1 Tax=Gomphillus americanus TaxID=1940652 RepID=A0A8H3EJZ1_9LECA|nr:MAG: hypothetical protein GOMPHAMPRED_003171 [Gomphillus americanus]